MGPSSLNPVGTLASRGLWLVGTGGSAARDSKGGEGREVGRELVRGLDIEFGGYKAVRALSKLQVICTVMYCSWFNLGWAWLTVPELRLTLGSLCNDKLSDAARRIAPASRVSCRVRVYSVSGRGSRRTRSTPTAAASDSPTSLRSATTTPARSAPPTAARSAPVARPTTRPSSRSSTCAARTTSSPPASAPRRSSSRWSAPT